MADVAPLRRSRLGKGIQTGFVICLVVFHLVNNWVFVSTQVTILGWDRPAHLMRTLIYSDILQRVNLRSLFEVFTWSWNRPPLFHLSAVPLYRLFGVSTDVALMTNGIYLTILLLSVYGIGWRLYNVRTGLLAAFMVSTYPILFSISRMPYVDYALTAMVALCIYLLLACDGFRHRGYSLLLGLVIGLGILTKWPFIAFSGGPLAYVAVRSRALRDVKTSLVAKWEGSSRLRRLWASPALHAIAGLCLTLMWYWPNWDRVERFVLGYWLVPISWLMVGFTMYVLSRPPRRGANLLSAVTVGLTVGSLWSLPNFGFLQRFATVVYGGVNIEGRALQPMDLAFPFRYLRFLPGDQLSPLYVTVLLVGMGMLVGRSWHHRGVRSCIRSMGDSMRILLLWFGVPMMIFTLSLTTNPRFDVALLPPLALISARGLCEIKNVWIRRTLVGLASFAGLVQFFALSYDDLAWIRDKAIVSVPWAGRVNLLAEGSYIELPASGRNDERYFIATDILSVVQQDMSLDGRDAVQLGNLVNRSYSNNAIWQYLMYDAYPGIELREFARSGWEEPPFYERIFECDYLLMKRDPYEGLSEDAQEAVRIMEASAFFDTVFQVIWEYNLPDEDTIYLYKKRFHLREGYDSDDYRLVALDIESLSREEDGIMLAPPGQVEVLGRYYQGDLPPYPMPEEQPIEEQAMVEQLEAIVNATKRVFLVLWDSGQTEAAHLTERWLNEHAFRAWDTWHGATQLVLYGTSLGGDTEDLQCPVGAHLGDAISLEGYLLWDEEVRRGDILRVTLHWRALESVHQDYAVFAHLLDEDGTLVAQRDSDPVGGTRPTSDWEEGETISDNYGILIPDGLSPGEYRLVAGMYVRATGERLSTLGDTPRTAEDSVSLGAVWVTDE